MDTMVPFLFSVHVGLLLAGHKSGGPRTPTAYISVARFVGIVVDKEP